MIDTLKEKRFWIAAAFVLLITFVGAPANAQTYLTPHIGVAFEGPVDGSKLTYGGDLAFTGGGPLGFSVDFGYTKDFFGEPAPGGNNNLTTLMGNLMFITPGKARFYGSAGAGLLKTRVQDAEGFLDVSSNDWGMNAGAGVYIVGSSRLGFRGDVRYFRRLTDPEPDGEFDLDFGSLSFWRASGGLVIRF
jgi:hypothetical protein